MSDNIFEIAARMKIRIPYKGSCMVEDLWDLPVQKLDDIFQLLNAKLNTENGESLLGPKSGETSELALQVKIIRHIVGVKLAEAKAAENREVHRQNNAMIDGIIAGKRQKKLMDLSEEQLLLLHEDV